MDFEVMKAYLPRFWDALLLTLRIGWQGVALALALGVACAVAVHWKIPVLRQIVGGYIELFRKLFLRQCALFSERSDILCKLILHLLRFPPFFGGIFALRLLKPPSGFRPAVFSAPL